MSAPGLSDEARQAVNAAFDAMSTWRIETAKSNEKNSEQAIEKMAAAARTLGWPEQIVDVTGAQLQSITKMQTQVKHRCNLKGLCWQPVPHSLIEPQGLFGAMANLNRR